MIWPWIVQVGVFSKAGLDKSQNEDAAGYLVPPPFWLKKGILFAVADGVGGRPAASLAARSALGIFLRSYYLQKGNNPLKWMERATLAAHKQLSHFSEKHLGYLGMATTLTGVSITSSHLHVSHVGDSRVLLIRNKKVRLLTRDHTIVRRLASAGGYFSHVLTQAVGVGKKLHPDTLSIPMYPGDIIVLVTDGVHNALRPGIIGWISVSRHPQHAAVELVRLARDSGSRDDSTAIVVRLHSAPWVFSMHSRRIA